MLLYYVAASAGHAQATPLVRRQNLISKSHPRALARRFNSRSPVQSTVILDSTGQTCQPDRSLLLSSRTVSFGSSTKESCSSSEIVHVTIYSPGLRGRNGSSSVSSEDFTCPYFGSPAHLLSQRWPTVWLDVERGNRGGVRSVSHPATGCSLLPKV